MIINILIYINFSLIFFFNDRYLTHLFRWGSRAGFFFFFYVLVFAHKIQKREQSLEIRRSFSASLLLMSKQISHIAVPFTADKVRSFDLFYRLKIRVGVS